jgi:hypothetical protein
MTTEWTTAGTRHGGREIRQQGGRRAVLRAGLARAVMAAWGSGGPPQRATRRLGAALLAALLVLGVSAPQHGAAAQQTAAPGVPAAAEGVSPAVSMNVQVLGCCANPPSRGFVAQAGRTSVVVVQFNSAPRPGTECKAWITYSNKRVTTFLNEHPDGLRVLFGPFEPKGGMGGEAGPAEVVANCSRIYPQFDSATFNVAPAGWLSL